MTCLCFGFHRFHHPTALTKKKGKSNLDFPKVKFQARMTCLYQWTDRELNPRPLPCQGSDLPLIYQPDIDLNATFDAALRIKQGIFDINNCR